LLITSIAVNNASAQEALVLPKGSQAPFTGLLLPEQKAIEVYNDLNKYKLLSESYERSIALYKSNEEILDNKTKILLEQNDKLSTQLSKARTTSNIEKAVYYALGFLSVIGGAYAVKFTSNL
jgi:hypothetical protein